MAEKINITPESTIPQILKERIRLQPDQLAQIDGDGRMTYGQFGERVNKLASGLIDLGIKPGEKVSLVLPSGNTFPVAMHAVIQVGAVCVGINPTLKANEFRHIFSDSESSAVIVAESIYNADPIGIIREMRDDLPHLRYVIVDGLTTEAEINLETLIEKSLVRDKYHEAEPHELTALVYTSGTTGVPKGSMHSHKTMLFPLTLETTLPPIYKQIMLVIKRYGVGYAWRVIQALKIPITAYSSLPPYTGGGTMGVIGSFIGGSIKVHMDRFSPTKLLEMIEKERITSLSMPPALGMLLIRNPNIGKYDLSSLMYVTLVAAPVPPSLIDEFKERLGCPVLNVFGATEMFGGPATMNPFTDSYSALRESIGKVRQGYEARIVDEDRKPVPNGEVGELAVRTGVQMLGYYKADALTKKTFDEDGWYYTGDQSTMDEDGYIRIVGRIKDMIIRGGQNIYPAELEDILVTHPKVSQAAVIGIPDPIAGEKILAYIIPAEDTSPTIIEILNFCRENFAPYKVPSNVNFVDEFPLNATGKVLKRVLREEAMSELRLQTDPPKLRGRK